MPNFPAWLALVVLAILVGGCWRHHSREPRPRADAGVDGGTVSTIDAGAPPDLDAGGCGSHVETVSELGTCFELSTCCSDGDCSPGWTCSARGYCVDPARPCSCVDGSCSERAECQTNEIWCGVCQLQCTTDLECGTGSICVDGNCVEAGARCVRYEDWSHP